MKDNQIVDESLLGYLKLNTVKYEYEYKNFHNRFTR